MSHGLLVELRFAAQRRFEGSEEACTSTIESETYGQPLLLYVEINVY